MNTFVVVTEGILDRGLTEVRGNIRWKHLGTTDGNHFDGRHHKLFNLNKGSMFFKHVIELLVLVATRAVFLQQHHPTAQSPSTSYLSCLIEHFVVCGTALFSPLKSENRGLSSCRFVNLAMLVQSVVRDPRQWSNRQLNLVLHFHVSHSCSWYTIIWSFMSMVCRCCAVNMWTHSSHASVEHPLPQSTQACLVLMAAVFMDYNQFFYLPM